jgi:hypothetical protein
MVMFFSEIFLLSCFLSAGQVWAEIPPDILQPRPSHRTALEKKIVVSHEILVHWKAVKIAVIDKIRGTENVYIVPIGVPFTVTAAKLTITVDAFLPAFTMEGTTITSSSNELWNPAAKVTIDENGTLIFQGWLFSKFPTTHAVTHRKYGFSLIGAVPR